MATLEKIRNHAGLLVIVVGLALFAFIINDALNSGSTYLKQSQDEVASVDGTPIKYMDYNFRIEEMTEVFKIQSQTTSVTDEYKEQINQSVYDMMVREIVMNNAFGNLGIQVTPDELFDMVEGENVSPMVQQFPLFIDPSTGAFSKAYALEILKSFDNLSNFAPNQRPEVERLRNFWLFWERNMKTQRLQEKYMNLLSKALVTNPLEAKDAYEASAENSDIVFVTQPYTTIPDSLINVDNDEIRKLYNERKEQYKQKESRIVDYIAVEVRPSEADYENARTEIEELKNELASTDDMERFAGTTSNVEYADAFQSAATLDAEMKAFAEIAQIGDIDGPVFANDSYTLMKLVDKTVAPDSVRVYHIFLTVPASPNGGVDDAITAQADSLLGVLKNGGDFAALVEQYSLDDQTKTNGGEIGWLTEIGALQVVRKELKDAIFGAVLNQPTILKTSYGIHILKITEKTANVPKYKIAQARLTVTPGNKTFNDTYNQLSQFVANNNSSEKIAASAAEAGFNLISGVRITTIDRILGAVPNSRSAIRWAFETTRKNEVSNIIDCSNQFVVVVRRDVLPEGYQPVNTVAPILRSEIAAKKKGEQLARSLKEKNLQTLQAYADAMNSPIDTVRYITPGTTRITKIGLEPVLNAEIAYSQPNQLCGPIVGNNGVYVFMVINHTQEGGTYNETEQIRSMDMTNSYKGYQAFQQLVDETKITDNRIRFD
ncbi:MAG: SurA N-terminal domain-containing protein [Tannerella sp.]|jgi:peptidyl-prolyl cis-trans isomerase D|nr:SurA N-terminal domain-containing protein [Tannerella sp.]